MTTLCESCQRRPAYRVLYLSGNVPGFHICQPCDLRALESERRSAVRHVQRPHPADPTDSPATIAARCAVLDTIRIH